MRMRMGMRMGVGMEETVSVDVVGAEAGMFNEAVESRADPNDAAEGEAKGQVASEETSERRSGIGMTITSHR